MGDIVLKGLGSGVNIVVFFIIFILTFFRKIFDYDGKPVMDCINSYLDDQRPKKNFLKDDKYYRINCKETPKRLYPFGKVNTIVDIDFENNKSNPPTGKPGPSTQGSEAQNSQLSSVSKVCRND